VRVVAAKGYGGMTIVDLTKEAGVSRTTFYELYEDKEACFLAAYDNAVEVLVRRGRQGIRVRAGLAGAGPPPGLAALLDALAEEPALARLSLVDIGNAGPAAQRRYRTRYRG
jgi:AcrR family transcriptional regulator